MVDKHIALVKGQCDYYSNLIQRFPEDSPRYRPAQVRMYERLLHGHQDLLNFLEGLRADGFHPEVAVAEYTPSQPRGPNPSNDKCAPQETPRPTGKKDDLSDLPPELLEQLSTRLRGGSSDEVVDIINERGGTASLDDILIDLYRRTGKIETRAILANRLHRLAKRGLLSATEGRKGIYTTAA